MTMDKLAWLALASGVIGGLIQLLKKGLADKLGLPRSALPWIALSLGLIAALVQYFMGKDLDLAGTIELVVGGAVSGLVPVAVHELGTDR
jgi:hypothetical protein